MPREIDRCVVKPKAEHEAHLLSTLAARYFAVIPQQYRTYCSLTAEVSRRVLKHFGVEASLLPCQVWCSSTNGEHHVVGFVGRGSTATKWDGHVVCITNAYVLDASLHHFEREFSVPVPAVLAVQRTRLTSQSIAVATLAGGQTLLWLQPPHSGSVRIPKAPTELVNELAQKLIVDLQDHGAG